MMRSRGDVAGSGAVLPCLVAAGDGVVHAETAVETGDGLLAHLVEDEEGVGACDPCRGVDACEETPKAHLLMPSTVMPGQAHTDDLDAPTGPCGVFDEAETALEDGGSVLTGERLGGVTLRPWGEQGEGLDLHGRPDAAIVSQLPSPAADPPEEVVPGLGVNAERGANETASALTLIEVVEPHGAHLLSLPVAAPPGASPGHLQAVGSSGPNSAIASR